MIIRTSSTLVQRNSSRNLSKYVSPDRSARAIRKKFLDYFIKDCNHHFVRSSPVVPYCDPSVAFVNAGMNQFKSIFVGQQEPKYKRVANSQKCIRVGGKHNDLNTVGTDGYHHTFFEMLGNWSFGDYFKAEACELAWKLLLDVYKIPSNRLYVTYFKGDEELMIEEDLETKEIWRSLGVSCDRIIPFGTSDNFWEMGEVGPCGPCTEIHYDHIIGTENRSSFINKGLFDLTELWNIVFIEYNRNPDGTISVLPDKHVDTGMGFERLTAILQNKTSDYDTDNFDYLITAIEKSCSNIDKYNGMYGERDWNNLDTSYRILADHSRMVTASLADGIIPEQNQKLRRILRKCFCLGTDVFGRDGLMKELSNYVVDSLGPVYPEMERNISQIHQIIDYEEEVYKDLRKSAQSEWGELLKQNEKLKFLDVLEAPSLIPAYKDLMKIKPKKINGEIAFKLYDTFGLDRSTIDKLANCLGLPYDKKELQLELEKAKKRSKQKTVTKVNSLLDQFQKESVPKTCDTSKYNYVKREDNYEFEPLRVKILRIIHHDEMVKKIGPDTFCSLLLDQTNLYSEAGGQVSDRGTIQFEKAVFNVVETENLNSYILHKGFLKCKSTYSLSVDSVGTLSVDEENRLNIMRNHTATHLLNSVVKQLKGATCQKSSKVTEDFLNLDVGIFGPKLTIPDVEEMEYKINSIISKRLEVVTSEINSQKLLEYDDIITVPGEIYPEDNLRLVEIRENDKIISREPCCGTHVFNTSDIGNISIIKLKSLGRSTVSLSAVTGTKSKIATENASEISDEVSMLQKTVSENIDKPDVLNIAVASLRNKIIASETLLPIYTKQKCLKDLDDISKRVKNIAKVTLNEFIDMEMQNVLDSKVQTTDSRKQYIIHYLRTSMILETVPLQRATKMCKNLPIMVISYTDNVVQARCCVPKQYCSDKFTADKWLKESVVKVFDGYVMNVKGQSEKLVCNMKPKRVNIQDWDFLLKHSMSAAQEFVEKYL